MTEHPDELYHTALHELRVHVGERAAGVKPPTSTADDVAFWYSWYHPVREPLSDGWQARGTCKGAETDLWFPEAGDSQRPAQRVCVECPVMLECLQWSVEAGEVFGVWGGLPQKTRKVVRRAVAALDAEVAA